MVVGGSHAFAHQHGIRAGATVILDLDRTEHARLCDAVARHRAVLRRVRRPCSRQPFRFLRLRALMPMIRAPAATARRFLLGGVRFDEHSHAELVGRVESRCASLSSSSAATMSSTEVGAVGTRLVDLVVGDDEVLAQQRNVNRRADLVEIVQRAEEPPAFGEHGNRARTAALVFAGQGRRGRGYRSNAPWMAGQAPLDFGDHGDAVRTLEPSRRVDRRRRGQSGPPHILKRHCHTFAGTLVFQRPGNSIRPKPT